MYKGPEGEEKGKKLFRELQALPNLLGQSAPGGGNDERELRSWAFFTAVFAEVRLTQTALWSPVCGRQLLRDRMSISNLQTQPGALYTTGAQKMRLTTKKKKKKE